MPTYQYVCTNPECRHDFELVQSFTDPAASECPVCGQPVRKRFGAVGVVFKGSGFYRTDSRSESSAAKASSNGKSGDGGNAKSGDSKPGESKPAAKTDTSSGGSGSSSSSGSTSTGSGSGSAGRVAASA